MKKIAAGLFLFAAFAFVACSDDDESGEVTEYALSDLYGYTFGANFTSSSGTQLTPELVIYDDRHLDWNMSTSGMSVNSFYYTAEKTATNKYTLYWYDTAASYAEADTSKASMNVIIGINSASSVSVMVNTATAGAGNAMAGKPIEMTRTSAAKKTYTASGDSESSGTTDLADFTVSGSSAEWAEETSTYTGTIKIHVLTTEDGSSGEGVTPSVTVTKTDGNTATVKTPALVYSGTMEISAFDVVGCDVTKDGDVYYLSKGEFTSSDGNYEIHGSSLKAKLEDGVLTLQVVFKPGNMPLDITELFTSSN